MEIVKADVASIKHNDETIEARVLLSIAKDRDGYFVATDSGEDASQYRFATLEKAEAAIEPMWSASAWDLQFA